jgi:hypothetical protein
MPLNVQQFGQRPFGRQFPAGFNQIAQPANHRIQVAW